MDHGAERMHVAANVLKSAIESIVLVPFKQLSDVDKQQADKILLDVLQDVHHPAIGWYKLSWSVDFDRRKARMFSSFNM